jgi:ABC-type Mn2+/Zn2+ transport system ATPase subunit
MTILSELQRTSRHLSKHRAPHPPDAPILRVEHLNVAYDEHLALEDISFSLGRGDRLAIVGPNGAGKSTLLKVIAGVLRPSSGQADVFGHEPGGHICIAYVPQRSQVDWRFPVTVADVVMMGRVGRLGLFRNPKAADWRHVHQALETVGMTEFAKRQISQLSGGQQQRMFIARALAQEAELMLMDEPLTGLDVHSQEDVFSILDELQARQVTVLVSLHDLEMAASRFDVVLLLNRRMIGIGAAAQALSPENLLTAYGGHLRLVETESGTLALGDTCCDKGDHR